ncbi:cupin domain-containing protein [Prosthecochloris sp.]|uniref:cupin domain-containing protein n=1 Tax=Prosthecochloris sp. TaxID=290513 RepID=UPI0025803E77|nr:cupin domain-containing protein [Prosthecochloris sp.]
MIRNVFSALPEDVSQEVVEDLVRSSNVRIERIVSYGHSSPETGWYDQDESEWVIVLDGSGSLLFENGREIVLRAGDYIDIPAHTRHKVLRTDKVRPTIWLAVFYT